MADPLVGAHSYDDSADTAEHNPLDRLTSWHSDWSGLRVAVLGLGMTGFAAADTLAELGADVLVVAGRAPDDRARLLDVLGIPLVSADLDTPPAELIAHRAELVIVSPGFHPDHALLQWAAAERIPVWGDIELACATRSAPRRRGSS
jgi:UDP-N-acetylmuramoylalanine--D-glutamate ligase